MKKYVFLILIIMLSISSFGETKKYFKSEKNFHLIGNDSLELVKKQFRNEMIIELENILSYWIKNAVDYENGGFIGKINGEDTPFPKADKGLVLNSRILWTFSAAYLQNPKEEYKKMANRSYEYLMKYFWDNKNGGAYWSVDYLGNPKERHKQIYGQGFLLYGLSEYYRAFKDPRALNKAKEVYYLLVKNALDILNLS